MSYFSALEKAVELNREGQFAQSIAQYLNEHGFKKNRRKTWTHHMVRDLFFSNGKKLGQKRVSFKGLLHRLEPDGWLVRTNATPND